MEHTDNISELIKNRLPAEIQEILSIAGKVAGQHQYKLYMVGGIVRDLLLSRLSLDLDLVVEGDAVEVARSFAEIVQGKVTLHTRFRTATVKWEVRSVDFATARSETYPRPGALPTVKAGDIKTDLSRRDFTINSLAVDISSGELIDPYNGREDIEKRLVRILHEKSFIDDATRIWRAVRYEQRLDFTLEPDTLSLLKRDINMLDNISRDRIRHELELVLKEEYPEKTIRRAAELGVLEKLHQLLLGDDWTSDKFRRACEVVSPDSPTIELYLALLAYRLTKEETEELIRSLGLRKLQTQTLKDTSLLKGRLNELSATGIKPSEIYNLLHGVSHTAVITVSIAADIPTVKRNIGLYLDKLRYVRTALTGKDLEKMGIQPGPHMKEILGKLLEARLDGQVTDKQGEIEMVKKITHH
ncbi:MAG: CCA tRNA nucleotidyltransferase [Dehalococcoidales bacterium]|nr:CCA tRNA nucleotidyltransferase [Dehalococcoidales bacterium]